MPLAGLASIGHVFGGEFANAIGKVKAEVWTGPIASGFGLHIVRVSECREGCVPADPPAGLKKLLFVSQKRLFRQHRPKADRTPRRRSV